MKIVKQLPVKLTDEEVDIKTKQMVAQMADFDEVEEKKKSVTKQYSDKMKDLRESFTELRRIVTARKEDREVECYREANLPRKVWQVHRSDTGEVVEQTAMSQHEVDEQRQLDLTTFNDSANTPNQLEKNR